MAYNDTTLWKTAFANKGDDNDHLRETLVKVFEESRSNAEFLLKKIRKDFPNLTVHDINHIDGLWQVASTITGNGYEINPLEGFVLGCSFLMHDAVLSYDAFGGQDVLRATDEWKDYYEDYKKDSKLTGEDQLFETDFRTIRLLHAKKAETLYNQLFARNDGSTFYIINDQSLREHYGSLICKIAASHHWSIDEVQTLGNQQSAIDGYPNEWRINPVKLACILRCADAGHIDAGRAPDYLMKLLTVNGISRDHWIAQNRLSQLDVDINDDSKVRINSNIDFKEDDFAAWNVAYDAVVVLDHELHCSNDLLKHEDSQQFQAKGVTGAESREALSALIRTSGWQPCDANIHISNVEGLIQNLGGEKLYGKEHKLEIVIRELVQNARDSIVARRHREDGFVGRIDVKIEVINGDQWLEVIDDGLGMSMQTIKDYFLNFGSSFWGSDLAKREYPGLNASGYKSSGRFGIGFYSVFMIASEVIVETRKYDEGLDENRVLRFPNGLCLRPIIKKQRGPSTKVSTSVKVKIGRDKITWNKDVVKRSGIQNVPDITIPYTSVLSNLTAGLDVDVYYSELDADAIKVHHNINDASFKVDKWLKDITYAQCRNNNTIVNYIDNNYNRLRDVVHDGKIYGKALLNTLYNWDSIHFEVTTVGGLSTMSGARSNAEYLGCMFAEPDTAKRDGYLEQSYKKEWAQEQYVILQQKGLTIEDKLYLPYRLGKYDIDMTDSMYADLHCKTQRLRGELKQILQFLKNNKEKLVIPISDMDDKRIEYYLDYQRSIEKLKDGECLFITKENSDFLNLELDCKKFPFTFMKCVNTLAERLGYNLHKEIIDDKCVSHFCPSIKAMVISVD